MTINISFAGVGDGAVYSADPSYANVTTAGGTKYVTNTSVVTYGQSYGAVAPTDYTFDLGYFDFAYTLDAAQLATAAHFKFTSGGAHTATVDRNLDVAEYDWSGTLDAGDLRTAAQFRALSYSGTGWFGRVASAQNATAGNAQRCGTPRLLLRLTSTGTVRVVVASDRAAWGIVPTVDERCDIYSADVSGTSYDPALIWTTTPLSCLNRVGGAQAMLSDGTTVVLENTAAESDIAATHLLLRRVSTAGAATTIATLDIGTSPGFATLHGGFQSFALAVDASDNIYVAGRQTGANTTVCVKGFVKGSGLTWTPATALNGSLSTYDAPIDACAMAWHSVGGTKGTLVLLAASSPGTGQTNQLQGAFLSADAILAGTGTLLRGTFDMGTLFRVYGSGFSWYHNETMTGFDVAAAPGTTNRGYAMTYNGDDGIDTHDPAVSRYTLAADGASFTNVAQSEWDRITVARDANSKLRAIGIDATRCAVAGGQVPFQALQSIGTGALTNLGQANRDAITASTAPTTLYDSLLWDTVHDAGGNRLWLYYTSASDSRRLCRTGFNLSTMLPDNTETVVNAAVGASGSTNYAIRAPRGALVGNQVIITVANKTSGGTHSTVYVADTLNIAPNAPTLTPKANFDATASATFAWTFSDPNTGDTQSAFELDIDSASGTNVYDTGYLAGLITYVGTGAPASANNASVTPALPGGWAQGDLLLAVATNRNSASATVSAPGWTKVATSGNLSLLGQIATASATAPVIAVAGGSANADTLAYTVAFRGTHQDITTVVSASAAQLNSSAANIAYPTVTPPSANNAVMVIGWKADDWTSVATLAGMAEIQEGVSTIGDDAGIVSDYVLQTTAAAVASGSFTVTGGSSAISRALTVALKPASGVAGGSFVLPAGMLANGNSYQWRVRNWDSFGASGAYSSFGTFSTAAGGNVTITDPVSDYPAGVITSFYNVKWSATGTTQAAYRVEVKRVDTGATLSSTGWVSSSATNYDVTGLLTDVAQRLEVTVRNAGLVESGVGTRLLTPSYGTPEAPVLNVVSGTEYVDIEIINPTPTGSRPEVTWNDVLRREYGTSGAYVKIATVDPDSAYRDYAVASGVTYEYVVDGQA